MVPATITIPSKLSIKSYSSIPSNVTLHKTEVYGIQLMDKTALKCVLRFSVALIKGTKTDRGAEVRETDRRSEPESQSLLF